MKAATWPWLWRCAFVAPLLVALCAGSGGCSKAGIKLGGDPTDRVQVTSAAQLNDCDDSGSRPVGVRVYLLAATERFQDFDIEALWYGEPSQLGQDLIGAVKELTILPGTQQPVPLLLPREKGATAIGVVANFCEVTSGAWKRTIPLDKGDTRIAVHLERTRMTVTVAE